MIGGFVLLALVAAVWFAIELRNAPTDVELWGEEIE